MGRSGGDAMNQAGLDLVKSFEGCVLHAYQDSVGVWTIGYGHTKCVKPGMVINQQTADDMLANDLKASEFDVRSMTTGTALTENQMAALTSFVFNLGPNAMLNSTLLKMIRRGNLKGAADQFLKWDRAGGRELEGLRRRRAAERDLFLKP